MKLGIIIPALAAAVFSVAPAQGAECVASRLTATGGDLGVLKLKEADGVFIGDLGDGESVVITLSPIGSKGETLFNFAIDNRGDGPIAGGSLQPLESDANLTFAGALTHSNVRLVSRSGKVVAIYCTSN